MRIGSVQGALLTVTAAAALGGCRPSRESQSAPYMGCAASDVTIEGEDDSAYGSNTWVAECQGRRFICGSNTTPMVGHVVGGGEASTVVVTGERDVTCTEEAGAADQRREQAERAAEERRRAAALPRAAPPRGAAGFELGSTAEAARAGCEGAGKTWTDTGDRTARCSEPLAEVGFASEVSFHFCDGKACSLLLEYQPESDWLANFARLRDAMVRKYGEPSDKELALPSDCGTDAALRRCFLERDVKLRLTWNWPASTRIHLVAGKPKNGEGEPSIRIQYVLPKSAQSSSTEGL